MTELSVHAHCPNGMLLLNQGMSRLFFVNSLICCQTAYDAERIKKALSKRLAKYGLRLNEDKTKVVSFSKQAARQGVKQDAFDFLGFTFYWGHSRKGHAIPKVKTNGKRHRAKLKKVKEWVISVKNRLNLIV
jgi:RNA-directed DNA polymerase